MATIEGLTIKNGYFGTAGGIFNGGTLMLTGSTLSGNSAQETGGGIVNSFGATLTVRNSTISGNSASRFGGGIFSNYGGPVTITDSTISGNTTTNYGGGIYNHGGPFTLANTIVAGNSARFGPNANGPFTSQGYNLVGDTAYSWGWNVGSDLLDRAPLLGPLQDNGGPTHTHALLAGSPAINAIPEGINGCGTTITTDQRGMERPQGGACDIGAFERDGTPPKVTSTTPTGKRVSPNANVTAAFSEAMDPATLDGTAFKLVKKGTTRKVAATVSYDAATMRAILNPTNNLKRGAIYIATVTTGANDRASNALDQDFTNAGKQPKSWRFEVR